MNLSTYASKYNFTFNNGILTIVTDFEEIIIDTNSLPSRYAVSYEYLMRFIDEELLEEFSISNSFKIPPAFFLPDHIRDLFIESIAEGIKYDFLSKYYDPINHKDFKVYAYNISKKVTIPNKEKGKFGTSLYLTEPTDEESLISAAQEVLTLNAMKDFKIAIGSIRGEFCLLEVGMKKKQGIVPITKHCNLWKISESICKGTFEDIANNFKYA